MLPLPRPLYLFTAKLHCGLGLPTDIISESTVVIFTRGTQKLYNKILGTKTFALLSGSEVTSLNTYNFVNPVSSLTWEA